MAFPLVGAGTYLIQIEPRQLLELLERTKRCEVTDFTDQTGNGYHSHTSDRQQILTAGDVLQAFVHKGFQFRDILPNLFDMINKVSDLHRNAGDAMGYP